jgi:uncharacterized protein
VRIVAISDTHIPDFAKRLPTELYAPLRRADLILHAGDVTSPEVLEELATLAPVHAALGNGDGPGVEAWGAVPEVLLDVGKLRLAVVHDSGPRQGRERRMARRFPDADVVVFGHSHIPVDFRADGLHLFNPGSPTWKRRQPAPTYGELFVTGRRVRSRIVELPA